MPVKPEDIKENAEYLILKNTQYQFENDDFDPFFGRDILKWIKEDGKDYTFYDSRVEWLKAIRDQLVKALNEVGEEIAENYASI